MRIAIIAGEISGDMLAASLIQSLKEIYPDAEFVGIAGPKMLAAGCKALFPMEKLAVMGFVDVLKHLKQILSIRKNIINYFLKNPPDIFIGVDAPDFNLTVEEKLKAAGIKTVHYVSPSVWAWKKWRLKKITRAVDLMLTLLPFEAKFYEQYQIPVEFVGHPFADEIPLEVNQLEAKRELMLPNDKKIVALLPGSRKQEIEHLAEPFIKTAQYCLEQMPDLFFIVPMVSQERLKQFNYFIKTLAPDLPVKLVLEQSRTVLAAADVVLVASGTATLETMLFNKPMVIAYRMAALNYLIGRCLINIQFIGLPNLLANKLLIPEFIQEQATVENLSLAILNYLSDAELVKKLHQEFFLLHQYLRKNASKQAAIAIQSLLEKKL